MDLTDKIRAKGYDAVAIVGPTASGKTGLSVALAEHLGAEIISCDSMQIYEGMDIGTAKATEEERRAVRHHLIDICPLSRTYSAADYVKDATAAAREIISRGRLPIFCGGTGLYLDGVMRGEYPTASESDGKLRRELAEYANEHGKEALHEMLRGLDEESAQKIHPNNVKRVIRAIEIAKSTGLTKTELDAQNSEYKGLRIFVVCLYFANRELLYSRIEKRVDMMLENGLCAELEGLMRDPCFMNNTTASQAIGYKELFPYVRGEASLEECADRLKVSTRRYAKRQLTWFLGHDYVKLLSCDREDGSIKSTDVLAEEFEKLLDRE